MPSEFIKTGELELSNSGKSVKLYLFENGRRHFIGQVTRRELSALLNGDSLKAGICKYQNASEAVTQP